MSLEGTLASLPLGCSWPLVLKEARRALSLPTPEEADPALGDGGSLLLVYLTKTAEVKPPLLLCI